MGRNVGGKGCTAVVKTPRLTHRKDPTVGAAAEEATRRELAAQPSVASYLCRPPLALQAELGRDAFSIGRGSKPEAGFRGRAPLSIGPAVNRLSICERGGFVCCSGCAQGGPLRVPCSHWLGAVSLGTWRRWRPGLLPAALGATGNR